MPLPGGPSNKLGNRYELWWTVSQLLRILDGEAKSIRFEDPAVNKAEFVLTTDDHQELHQAKRNHREGKWSLPSLRQENLLQAIFDQLSNNPDTRFVFVSGSDAPELRELTERARNAGNTAEFESVFIGDKTNKVHFKKLRSFWRDIDPTTAYEILQRIEVRTIDEREIEERVRESLSARFLTEPSRVFDTLCSIIENSIHRTINRDDLISNLQHKGFRFRQLSKPTDAPMLVASTTDHYLESTRRRLIQNKLISRSSTQELLTKIQGAKGTDCVVTGKAGGGKTGCVIECVETLRQGDNPAAVLVFRLDRIEPVSSTQELGLRLGLEESPALVLAAAAEATASEAVLVIDQLDAVSTTSGRHSDFFDRVEDLLSEVRGWRDRVKFHVVVVCRTFDWENDHRLRRLFAKDAAQISVADFSLDEVKEVLTNDGFRPELFDARQLELLRLPQNLALFLDTGYDLDLRPTFFLAKDLFDQYWEVKRDAVNARVASSDHWQEVIHTLSDEMTASQHLSVLKEKLDQFPNDYLHQMVSEGVLSFDRNRYGFGHESFFDYCFARGFIAKEKSLAEFLLASEQHLFRRAQVRQVFVYLRDADRERYSRELRALLTHQNVRYHLKDLAVALAVSLPDPEESEWDVLVPWIKSELETIKSGNSNSDKFASLVWNHFSSSQPWFQIADKRGLVTEWLTSDNDRLVDVGVNYARFHQRHSSDRVAELLDPFVGRVGDWPQRLSFIMQWADLEHSRRFFELFLRLIDDGTLDNARGPIASNSTFWSMLYGLSKSRPDWIAEVTAHWLLRRLAIVQQIGSNADQHQWHALFNHDQFGVEPIQDAAANAPEAFAQHVLPAILKIADEAVFKRNRPAPKCDEVWGMFQFSSKHPLIEEACRSAIAVAVERLAETKAHSIDVILRDLCNRDTYMANFLLLRAYTAGAERFADDAVSDLCDNTWRFQCGYSDSPYWVATQLIKAVAPLCSDENRVRLEQAILTYTPPYEETLNGYKSRGRASFNLLSGIPIELRSPYAQARYMELKRKFESPTPVPEGTQVYKVGSPIQEDAAGKMTDEQWLKAIQKYDSEERPYRLENPGKGGALELARMLGSFVKQEPERFARMSLRFPIGTHPYYIGHILSGLKETDVSTELKLKVCRKTYGEYPEACGKELADMLGSIEESLPDDAVQMLAWLATEHPDPDQEIWNEQVTGGTAYYGGDILGHGINTARGCAAGAIQNLIHRDASYIQRFRSAIERLVNDGSAAVRSCAASTLLTIVSHESQFALGQFHRLVEPRGNQTSDERLLATPYIECFINYGLHRHFDYLRPVVERLLRSNLPETSNAGARLASIAALLGHNNAEALVEEALHGHPSQRLGVAQVASANIGHVEDRQWSEQKLLLLFDDDDSEVRREAATCFRYLESQSLETYEHLIDNFCNSTAYQEDSYSLLHTLDQSTYKLPPITFVAFEKFLERFGTEARDISTHRFLDGSILPKLILRTYHQHQRDESASKCLDLIDRMCLEQSHEIRTNLDKYER